MCINHATVLDWKQSGWGGGRLWAKGVCVASGASMLAFLGTMRIVSPLEKCSRWCGAFMNTDYIFEMYYMYHESVINELWTYAAKCISHCIDVMNLTFDVIHLLMRTTPNICKFWLCSIVACETGKLGLSGTHSNIARQCELRYYVTTHW